MAKSGRAVQVTGPLEHVSRMGVREVMTWFGQVTHVHKPPACGDPIADAAIVHFSSDDQAEAAVKALKGGLVYIDGHNVGGDFHSGRMVSVCIGSSMSSSARALADEVARDQKALGSGEDPGGQLAVRGERKPFTIRNHERFDEKSESLRDLVMGGGGGGPARGRRDDRKSESMRDLVMGGNQSRRRRDDRSPRQERRPPERGQYRGRDHQGSSMRDLVDEPRRRSGHGERRRDVDNGSRRPHRRRDYYEPEDEYSDEELPSNSGHDARAEKFAEKDSRRGSFAVTPRRRVFRERDEEPVREDVARQPARDEKEAPRRKRRRQQREDESEECVEKCEDDGYGPVGAQGEYEWEKDL